MRELSGPLEPQPTGTESVLNKMDGIKAVIFDVYGTLMISGSGDLSLAKQTETGTAIQQAFQMIGQKLPNDIVPQTLSDLFFTTIDKNRSKLSADGVDFPDIDIRNIWLQVWEQLYHDGVLQHEPKIEAIPLLSNEYECHVNPTWPMPHLHELIGELNSRDNTLGIVSNAQFFTPLLFDAHLHQSLDDLDFDWDLCFFSYKHKVAKPSPSFYEKCAKALYNKYSLRPEQALYVGNDMLNDVWPARKFGFKTALFAGDKRSLRWREENPYLKDVKPDNIITDLMQILEIL